MSERTVVVASSHGLHARPAALFTQTAAKAGLPMTIKKGERSVDALVQALTESPLQRSTDNV